MQKDPQSAEETDKYFHFAFGLMYDYGHGLRKNNDNAMREYVRAANLGHHGAFSNIGVKISLGEGVPMDDKLGCEYFAKAAEADDIGGNHILFFVDIL